MDTETRPLAGEAVLDLPFLMATGASRDARMQNHRRIDGVVAGHDAVLAAFASLLSRYSGQTRIPIDRLGPGPAATFTVDLAGNPSFEALADQVAAAEAELPRHSTIAFGTEDHSSADLGSYDVVLVATRDAAGLRLSLDTAQSRIESGAPDRLLANLETLLQGALQSPSAPMQSLEMLSESERKLMLVDWNTTRAPYPELLLHEFFEACAARSPEAVAVIAGRESVTYGELNARANRLAHELVEHGVGPEVLVGIALERGVEMLVSAYAILKAGGAYIPLDPSNPPQRQALILEDADLALLLTQRSLAADYATLGPRVILVDEIDVQSRSALNPAPRAHLDNVAYIIYTSGSTGRPKGVVIEHRSLAAFLGWVRRAFSDAELGGVLFATSLAFDVSVFEIFGPLSFGGRLILIENILALHDAPAKNEVTTIAATASGFAGLLRGGTLPASVTTALQAGERLHGVTAAALYAQPGMRRLLNLCGGTEDTVYSVSYEVERDVRDNPPIGRPFDNHEVYLLDERMRPVPIGVPGEIYYAGLGVAREYLKRPELTKTRFVPNPFATSSYDRLYRSGDIARFRPDGNMEYLHRADTQIKIRGFRVELSEIEQVFMAHRDVAEAIVVAVQHDQDVRLAIYVVGSAGEPSFADLRAYAAERLPAYMVPSTIMALDALPQDSNGKLDRKALPPPVFGRPDDAAEAVAPGTPRERELAAMWRQFLSIDAVGIDDDFFELGGHSLMAAQIVAQLRNAYPALTLRDFIEDRTIRALANRLGDMREVAAPVAAVTIAAPETPLSHAQEQLWFLDRILPDGAVYNVPIAWRLRGPLDLDALQQALDQLLERHEQLRAVFAMRDGRPVMHITAPSPVPLRREHVANAEGSVKAALTREGRTTFDLEHGPLFRATLFFPDGSDPLLLLNAHHIVSDGSSVGIIADDLTRLYDAAVNRTEPALRPLPLRYAEYAVAEREAAAQNMYERDFEYWTARLAELPRIDMIGDLRPPRQRTVAGGRVTRLVTGETVSGLHAFARQAKTTTYAALLAAFSSFITRQSGEHDVVVGSPVSGRRYAEIEPLVGYFVSMVTMRLDTGGNPSFQTLATRAHTTVFDALEHQAAPITLLVERIAPQRDDMQSPLFSVAFVKQRPILPVEAGGVTFEYVPVETDTAKFDLLLEITELNEKLVCTFEYARDKFSDDFAASLLDSFCRLLELAVASPGVPLDSLPLVPATGERDLAAAPAPLPNTRPDVPVHIRFDEYVTATPDALAVVDGDTELTYRQLDAAANRLARRLRQNAVSAGSYVGVCMQRSAAVVSSILAILRCGATYVPIDPQYPPERIAFILEDAGVSTVLTDRESTALLPADVVPIIAGDDEPGLNGAVLSGTQCERVAPDDAAYVIYTSGSTGVPKGVVVTHRNVARLFDAAQPLFGFGADDVWTLFHSYAFDFSVWEIWGALAYGGTLVVVRPDVARSPAEFRRLVADRGVTVLNQTPSAFYEFIAADAADSTELRLRHVIFGGEALDVRQLEPWFARHGERTPRLVNMYGITETTVHVTFRALQRADAASPLGPIGDALPDLRVLLLDAYGNFVPDGFQGEIYVAGDGVAREYLGRRELTAERFPEWRGRRVYRSGDIARRRLDGEYEYVGRADAQVKIRGFRVELGEIEAVFSAHPAIERAIVMTERGGGGDVSLVAFVVPRPGAVLDDVRAYLIAKLPRYMVPSTIVPIQAVPLTANGKLDQRALAALPRIDISPTADHEPMSQLQQRVARLFCEFLNIESIGLDESFFMRGGHSLLAARFAARVEQEVPGATARLRDSEGKSRLLRLFYISPTVRALSALLEGDTDADSSVPIICMQQGNPSRPPMFWFHGMFNGDGLYTWDMVKALPADIPFYVLHPHGYDGRPFPADMMQLASEQLAWIRSVRPHGPYHLGGFCNGGLVAFEIATRLRREGEDVLSLTLVSIPRVLQTGPRLMKVSQGVADLLRLDDDQRSKLHLYLRSYTTRVMRFVRADAADRRRAIHIGISKVRRKFDYQFTGRANGAVAALQRDFGDPHFKNNHYVRAISEYQPSHYPGTIDMVWGREIYAHLEDPTNGWSASADGTRVHILDGGHLTLAAEHADQIGAIVRDLVEQQVPIPTR